MTKENEVKEILIKLLQSDENLKVLLDNEDLIDTLYSVSSTVLIHYLADLVPTVINTMSYIGQSHTEKAMDMNLTEENRKLHMAASSGIIETLDHVYTLLVTRYKDIAIDMGVPDELLNQISLRVPSINRSNLL